MAEISNIRSTPPVTPLANWTNQSKVIHTDQKKEQQSNSGKQQHRHNYADEQDDDNHLDEYA